MNKVLAIIPARKGSKGVKSKNKYIIGGKPLIQYTIETALKSKIDKVLVSTDCKEIRKISLELGAHAPFLRPKKLSTDNALTYDVVLHAIKYLKDNNEKYDLIILLQPTCPLRTSSIINKSINVLNKNLDVDSVVSVVDVDGNHPFRMKRIENNRLINFLDLGYEDMRPRQQLPKVYIRSGSIYAIRLKKMLEINGLVGGSVFPIIEKNDDVINIDNYNDLMLLKNRIEKN